LSKKAVSYSSPSITKMPSFAGARRAVEVGRAPADQESRRASDGLEQPRGERRSSSSSVRARDDEVLRGL
jgi:hypothetical protein